MLQCMRPLKFVTACILTVEPLNKEHYGANFLSLVQRSSLSLRSNNIHSKVVAWG